MAKDSNKSQHFVRIGGFRLWILPAPITAVGFKWATPSEPCDGCGKDEYELADDNIVCSSCKEAYTIRNADGTPATGFSACKPQEAKHDYEKTNLVSRSDGSDLWTCKKCGYKYVRRTLEWHAPEFGCKPKQSTQSTQKEDVMSKKSTPTKKVVKAKAKTVKVPRIGFGPFLRAELTKAPKTTLSVAKLASTMVKKFASTKRDEQHMRGWIYGIHRLLTKKGAAVSALDRGTKGKTKKGKSGDIC